MKRVGSERGLLLLNKGCNTKRVAALEKSQKSRFLQKAPFGGARFTLEIQRCGLSSEMMVSA
jgi:hypothetical protein